MKILWLTRYPIKGYSGFDYRCQSVTDLLRLLGHRVSFADAESIEYDQDKLESLCKEQDVLWINHFQIGQRFNLERIDCLKVLETHELVSVHWQIYKKILSHTLSMKKGEWDFRYFIHQFSPILDDCSQEFEPSTEEIDELKKYDSVVTISKEESDKLLSLGIKNTYLPTIVNKNEAFVASDYSGLPVYLAHNNLYNVWGYYYYMYRLAKEIDSIIRVIGNLDEHVVHRWPFEFLGQQVDLALSLRNAPYTINPSKYGAGSKMKIITSMQYGIPVITVKEQSSYLIEHGVNGYIATNDEDFIKYSRKLISNRTLCKEMGRAAKETVSKRLNGYDYIATVKDILQQ